MIVKCRHLEYPLAIPVVWFAISPSPQFRHVLVRGESTGRIWRWGEHPDQNGTLALHVYSARTPHSSDDRPMYREMVSFLRLVVISLKPAPRFASSEHNFAVAVMG